MILQNCAPPEEIGLWTGVYNSSATSRASSRRSSPAYLIAKTGSYAPPFILAAALIAAGPLAFWFIVGDITRREGG